MVPRGELYEKGKFIVIERGKGLELPDNFIVLRKGRVSHNIFSALIRKTISKGGSISAYLTPKVEEYIKSNKLYLQK